MIVTEMGFDVDPELETVQEVAVATEPIDTPVGVIEPGQVAARKFHWRASGGWDAGRHRKRQLVHGGGAFRPGMELRA